MKLRSKESKETNSYACLSFGVVPKRVGAARVLGVAVLSFALSLPASLSIVTVSHSFPIEQDDGEPVQELEQVTIWGSYEGTSGYGPWASNGDGTRLSDYQAWADPVQNPEQARFRSKYQDARCSTNSTIRNSSKNSSDPDRRIAADMMYQAYAAGEGRLATGTQFWVVYGDGGAEQWLIARSAPIGPTGTNVDGPVASSARPSGFMAPPSAQECSR